MSFPDVIASLRARIEAVRPAWDADLGFHAHEGDGVVRDIEAIPDDVTRVFDFRIASPPEDDGASGFGFDRWRCSLEVRVRYPIGDRPRSEMMIGSDTPRIIHALVLPSGPRGDSPWHAAIQTVNPPGAPRLFELLGPNGAPVALMLAVPFTVIYHDAGDAA